MRAYFFRLLESLLEALLEDSLDDAGSSCSFFSSLAFFLADAAFPGFLLPDAAFCSLWGVSFFGISSFLATSLSFFSFFSLVHAPPWPGPPPQSLLPLPSLA